ncbi:Uncharacterized membrane protein [Thermanaeromonas toyohensis ToBE]|uniref:Uncharacterized membrane protein n=1 Tax=Thermanaeromonas toyohensis ToBE TaxID=698762 RepID=A0A1W1W2F6_9FIRM|nr:DUF1634 domain-containing protein [Thermanaeromonas toyohensis]SMB99797.1 Uncharacterized membrane protein [Thermanaeromonas toyohensis ToBE]
MALFSYQSKSQEKISTLEIEDFISLSLRIGVIISSGIIGLGLLLLLVSGYTGYPDGNFPKTLHQVWTGLLHLKPLAIIAAGLLVLLATPIFRVAASMVTFFIQKDYQYTFIAGYVLFMLLLSLFLGKAE